MLKKASLVGGLFLAATQPVFAQQAAVSVSKPHAKNEWHIKFSDNAYTFTNGSKIITARCVKPETPASPAPNDQTPLTRLSLSFEKKQFTLGMLNLDGIKLNSDDYCNTDNSFKAFAGPLLLLKSVEIYNEIRPYLGTQKTATRAAPAQ
jgi:hypothetical protein